MGRKRYIDGKSYQFNDFTVSHVGKEDTNPETFDYPKEDPTDIGLSIRVHKVLGMGNFRYLEIAVYNQGFDEAVEMDLQPGESINFYGKYTKDKGRKIDFEKVSINLPMQVERYKGRPTKASEL
jgi:hypothetical protein